MTKSWFGKGCVYLSAQWEENEITGGQNYKEQEPVLKFCNNDNNTDIHEGNCNPDLCPLKIRNKINVE